jgi:DNA protecting protein DprA
MVKAVDRPIYSNTDNEKDWIGESVALLALSLMNGINYWTLWNIAQSGIGFKRILKANSGSEFASYLKQAGCKNTNKLTEIQQNPDSLLSLWNKAKNLYHYLKSEGIEVVHFDQEKFPESLRQIPKPPKWLFVQGNLSILDRPAIAIVGTRHPSKDGMFLADYVGLSLQYFGSNIVTVSGLAIGIDQIIHQNSIRLKIPTIAFLGTGILEDYPANSRKLRKEICNKGGAVVSEYLPSQSYSAENFVHRNRLQAGIADIIIPVEWKAKGGTAHTVRFAKEANKKIVCLRLPDWLDSHTELLNAKEMGANIFTIPGDENIFFDAVREVLKQKHSSVPDKNIEVSEPKEIKSKKKKQLSEETFHQLSILEYLGD